MKHTVKMSLGALLLASAGAAGCNDSLTGPGLTVSPNSPTSATTNQLFASIQVSNESQQEGGIARLASMFTQQLAGTGRQQQSYAQYSLTEADYSGYFSRIYSGGGLIDIRNVEAATKAASDSSYYGITLVLEALDIGMGASIWGDIPYSEAAGTAVTPKLDKQQDVYAVVQAKLDTAILFIGKTGGTNIGPGSVDLTYAGDRTKWTQAAYSLKARYYMHWVEGQLVGGAAGAASATACGGDCLVKTVAAAALGISSNANDWQTFHSTTSTEWNFWYQFIVVQRAGDLGASKTLVDTLKARRVANGDQRIRAYFDSVNVGGGVFDFRGADRNGSGTTPLSVLSAARLAQGFRQPIVTFAETQLLLAEAQARLGQNGPALVALNAAKAAQASKLGVAVPAAVALTGPALLTEIKAEEWIASFQNIEAYNDFKRNCYPRLTPALAATDVPGRVLYGSGERQTNPNIPSPANQPARNANDPKACSDVTHPTIVSN